MKKYNALYFIKKFEAIPESKWTTNQFHNNGKSCALGHCGSYTKRVPRFTIEATELMSLFNKHDFIYPVSTVNDGIEFHSSFKDLKLLGKTPKERILNALYLINAMEECE